MNGMQKDRRRGRLERTVVEKKKKENELNTAGLKT